MNKTKIYVPDEISPNELEFCGHPHESSELSNPVSV